MEQITMDELAIGVLSGKSMTSTLGFCYDMYVQIAVTNLLHMNRIPRKVKKRYKKSTTIWNAYLDAKKQGV